MVLPVLLPLAATLCLLALRDACSKVSTHNKEVTILNRIIALFVVLAAALAFASAAQAHTITYTMLDNTLRAGYNPAPDYDVAAERNWIEANCWNDAGTARITIKSATLNIAYNWSDHLAYNTYKLLKANGQYMHRQYYGVYQNDGSYHDGPDKGYSCVTDNVTHY